MMKDFMGRTMLDDLACIHDRNAVSDACYDAEIMRDQNHARAIFFLQITDQINDLRLNRHIKCCRRFIGNEQLRLVGKCNCDHDPLTHASGQLMRILLHPLFRLRDADFSQQIDCFLLCCFL